LYYSIMGSDGGESARRLTRGGKLDYRVSRMLWMAGLSAPMRWSLCRSLQLGGQKWLAHVVGQAGRRTAHGFWQLCEQLGSVLRTFYHDVFRAGRFQATLCPAHALPALPHGAAIDLLPAASYAFYANLLGIPAGVAPWTTVLPEEAAQQVTARDVTERRCQETLRGAVGLPMGVQIAAPAWHDHVVLRVMRMLESYRGARDSSGNPK
jgi:fatty acid amide hydrolase